MNREEAITDLVLETFRLNGRLLAAGDALVADLGLTSARWQVLGAIALSAVPLSVAQIARNMGLTRQAVQRLANEMRADGLVRFAPNPHHQRAKLVLLTAAGKTTFAAVMQRQSTWATELGSGLNAKQVEMAAIMLRTIRRRLDDRTENGGDNAA
jgi:DNA-binding MarR family transcriptional regulator